jgi:cysteine desulfurase
MLPFFTRHYGNAASRDHVFGWEAEEAVQIAREQVAALVHCETRELIFTSGATESVNLALKGVFENYVSKGKHIISVQTEHKAVLDVCAHVEKMGGETTLLGVDERGLLDMTKLESSIRKDTILIAVMYANNETGVVQQIPVIAEMAKRHGVIFFSDATQAVGKIPVSVVEDGIDLMAFSSHKIYGPKGTGALYVRRKQPRVSLSAQIHGGGHERGLRSGTLNVPGIVGFGKAAEICKLEMEPEQQRMSGLRDRLQAGLTEAGTVKINGEGARRLPNVLNISFYDIEGKALIAGINKQIAVSTGSACTSANPEPSHVLKAMGLTDKLAASAIRFSLGRFTTEEEIDFTIHEIHQKLNNLSKIYNQQSTI